MAPIVLTSLLTALYWGLVLWSGRFHFARDGKFAPQSVAVFVISQTGFLVLAICLWREPSGSWLAPLFQALALGLNLWTLSATRNRVFTVIFSADAPAHLYRQGPYQFVRHPFYLSYVLFWLGSGLATRSWLPWATFCILLLVYTLAAWLEEKKFTSSDLAGDYSTYRQSAGMFLPLPLLWQVLKTARR